MPLGASRSEGEGPVIVNAFAISTNSLNTRRVLIQDVCQQARPNDF
jgi:hypothetical protein